MDEYTWRFYSNRNEYSQLPRWILANSVQDIASIEMLEDGGFVIRVTHQIEGQETLRAAKAAAEAFFKEHSP